MRLVIQRVKRASVSVDGAVRSSIGRGLCVLVGVHQDDTAVDMEQLSRKLLRARLFDDDAGKPWSRSVQDCGLEVLCVSQFTLYGNMLKGNKPDFHRSMKTGDARAFYDRFLESLGQAYAPDKIKDGVFGAMMEVDIVNDGPVTIVVDSSATAPSAAANEDARVISG